MHNLGWNVYNISMLHIFCGDDTASSRAAYISKRAQLTQSGREVIPIEASAVADVIQSTGADVLNLFGEMPVYETTGLVSACKKIYGRKAKQQLRDLHADQTILLLDWEQKSAYDLGIDKDKFSFLKEYKLPHSTFTLLPTLIPGHKNECLKALRSLSAHQPLEVTFAMILRHVRLITQLAAGLTPKDNPFLIRLAQTSLSHFTPHQALKLYERLLSIDINVKTGRKTPLGLQAQLEVLIMMAL